MNRILLFLATNFAVVIVLSMVLHLLGLNQPGQSMMPLVIFAAIFGIGGAFVSLWMSKRMALRATGARLIDSPSNSTEKWLVETVRRQAEQAGIGMPDVAIFDSPAPNAFATGANRNEALVAVSTGLMQSMTADEVEAVLGHEVSHVANGDMVTLALLQGVINAFVMVFASIVASAIDRGRGGSRHGAGYFISYMLAQAVLGFLASMIVMWFSRHREFRADIGGASLAGRDKMINALERLMQGTTQAALPDTLDAFAINSGPESAFKKLLSTHPPLSARIAALRARQD